MASSSPPSDHRSTVDTSSPFRSVKEAIATYGEQVLARRFASDHQTIVREDFVTLTNREEILEEGQSVDLRRDDGDDVNDDDDYDDEDDDADVEGDDRKDLNAFAKVLKKLEDGLEETKYEIKLLKERESETEVALASLNAELHKNMSKIARLEANEAANMKYTSRSPFFDRNNDRETGFEIEERVRDTRKRMEDRPTLEQILSFGVCEGYFVKSKKVAKKKPIVPLVTDIFACNWKNKHSPPTKDKDDLALLSPLYYFR